MTTTTARLANRISDPASFLQPIEAELHLIEKIICESLTSSVKTVADISEHILDAGGKRLRPSLVALSASACPGDYAMEKMVNIAAAAEIVHMATLIHDDVVDSAELRRGKPTANSHWGNQISVLTGDYMVAKAFSILSMHGNMKIMQVLSEATVAMTEGEIRQIETRGDIHAQMGSYLTVIHGKTAAFISVCCRVGAILNDCDSETEKAISQYGLNLGMAFQITDDVLDLIGEPAVTGKPVGGDIREGKITIPLILALERSNASDRTALETILSSSEVSSTDIAFARKIAEETGALEGARNSASEFLDQAIKELSILPKTEARNSLEELAHYVLNRER